MSLAGKTRARGRRSFFVVCLRGRINRADPERRWSAPREAGVTLLELVIVTAIVAMIAGITYPAVWSGLESVHLVSATDNVASFINSALNRVERRQEVMQLQISAKESSLVLHSVEPGFERKLTLPDGISIVDPDPSATRQFMLLPGGTAPRIGIELKNRRGGRRLVRVDPMTGIPRVEIPRETT